MPKDFAVFIKAQGRTVLVPLDRLQLIGATGDQVVCRLDDGSSLTLGPFASAEQADRVCRDVLGALGHASDPRPTPTTREEYLQGIRDDPWRFPFVGGEAVRPPAEWVAEAWDLREVQFSIVDGGLVRDVGKGLGLSCSAEFLELLSSSLSTRQVVDLFLRIRRAEPHREREFRPAFERGFAAHAAALPPPLSREEVARALGMDEAMAQEFLGGEEEGGDPGTDRPDDQRRH